MADLRNLQVRGPAPTTGTNVPQQVGLGSLVGGALTDMARVYAADQVASTKNANNLAEQQAAEQLGRAAYEVAGEQASFLVDSVENEMIREAQREIIEDGGEVGETGMQVLTEATRMQKVEGYLRKSGQMNTLNQIRLLTKKQDLIGQRPDLAGDILKITDQVTQDSQAILNRNEGEARAAALAARNKANEEVDAILKANNIPTWGKTLEQKRSEASYWAGEQEQIAANLQKLTLLKQGDELAQLVEGQDKRTRDAEERARAEQSKSVVQTLVPDMVVEVGNKATGLVNRSGLTAVQRQEQWRQLQAQDEAALAVIDDPQLRGEALTRVRQAYQDRNAYISGEAMSDEQKRAVSRRELGARLETYNRSPEMAGLVTFAADLRPFLEVAIGDVQAQQAMKDTVPAILTALINRVPGVVDSEISTVPSPVRRKTRVTWSDGDPYVIRGQQPTDITDEQVANKRRELDGIIRGVAINKTATPFDKQLAAQSVITGLTAPTVEGDVANVKGWIEQLSSPAAMPAFRDSPDTEQVLGAVADKGGQYLMGVIRAIEKETGKQAKDIGRWNIANGNVVFEPSPILQLEPRLVQRLTQDANQLVRSIAHVQGSDQYEEVARRLLGQPE